MLRTFVAAITLSLAAPASAGEGHEWRPVDEATGQIRDLEGLEQLARDFPDSGSVRLRMLQPLLAAGEVEKVIEVLEWLYERGYVFSDVAQEQIPKMLEGVEAGRIAERLRAEAEVVEASEVVATVPAKAGLVESVWRASNGDTFFATSVTGKSLHLYLADDQWVAVPMPDASDLSGVVWDSQSGINWIASSNLDGSEGEEHLMTGLLGVADGLEPLAFALAPDGVVISDLAIGVDGTVYASDPNAGGIYRKLAGTDASLDEFIPPGTFRSPQGLATSADNSKLYVSDYRYGIAVVDLETRKVSRLASDIPVILDGVDGLWRYGNELIAVQNGTSPMRISAFELSEDGTQVISHRVLEQAHSEWTEPLSGSIDGDALIYVGNGQWDRYIEGELKEGLEALPTQIRRLPLASPAQ